MPQIRLPVRINSPTALFAGIWNSMILEPPARISQILEAMNHNELISFLNFMHHNCLHNVWLEHSQRRLEQFQIILMCCPRLVLTQFLLLIDEQCVVNLLERCDIIWTTYFVGLIELECQIEIIMILNILRIHQDFPFVSNLVLFLIQQASNQDLQLNLRERIFEFVCGNIQMVMIIVQSQFEQRELNNDEAFIGRMNEWALNFSRTNGFNFVFLWNVIARDFQPIQQPQHQAVNSTAFVKHIFPSMHPLHRTRDYSCVVCHCTPDEPNDDGTDKVVRMLPCCSEKCTDPNEMKYACHECLVKWANACNTANFSCPNCRHQFPFFP
jgi:hypothetical protein